MTLEEQYSIISKEIDEENQSEMDFLISSHAVAKTNDTNKRVADIVFILDATMAEKYKASFVSKLNYYLGEFFCEYSKTGKKLHSLRVSIDWFNDTDKIDHYFGKLPFTSIPDGKSEIDSFFQFNKI